MELRVAIVQQNIIWESPEKNKAILEGLFKKIDYSADLVVLPEMFLTGFSMNSGNIFFSMDSNEIDWVKGQASKYNMAILGSLAIKESDKIYNRALFVHPNGEVEFYDKRHLFTIGGENNNYSPGKERIVIDFKGVRIMPLICYDLRFPVWSRNDTGYELLIYMANWPHVRQNVWDILLKARAVENQCYVIGVNRIGNGGGIQYKGGSKFIDFKGNEIINMKDEYNSFYLVDLDASELKKFRAKFPVLLDEDKFFIHL